MKTHKKKNIEKTICQLAAATSSAETHAALRQLHKLVADASSEQRGQFTSIATRAVRDLAIQKLAAQNTSPRVQALHQELLLLKAQTNSAPSILGIVSDCNRSGNMKPLSEQLRNAETPEDIHTLIQNTLAPLSLEADSTIRQLKYTTVLFALESELLTIYLKGVNVMEDRYLPSLLTALESPECPTLALAFLDFDSSSGAFYTTSPSALVKVQNIDKLKQAITLYRSTLRDATNRDIHDCATMLKQQILTRLLDAVQYRTNRFPEEFEGIADALENLLTGRLSTGDDWKKSRTPETLTQTHNAISSICGILDTGNDAFKADFSDLAETLTHCAFLNAPLMDFTQFILTCKLLRCADKLKISLSPVTDTLLRVYFALSLAGDNALDDDALFAWVLNKASASEKEVRLI